MQREIEKALFVLAIGLPIVVLAILSQNGWVIFGASIGVMYLGGLIQDSE